MLVDLFRGFSVAASTALRSNVRLTFSMQTLIDHSTGEIKSLALNLCYSPLDSQFAII